MATITRAPSSKTGRASRPASTMPYRVSRACSRLPCWAWLSVAFNRALDRRLDALSLPPAVRTQIDEPRPLLAAAEVADPRGRRAIQESCVSAYRLVLWMGAGLAVAASVSAAVLIGARPD